jgi:hypothetical protein
MALIGKSKTPTMPNIVLGMVREGKANPHALPSLHCFTKGTKTAAQAPPMFYQ